jgi:hypothetical protein
MWKSPSYHGIEGFGMASRDFGPGDHGIEKGGVARGFRVMGIESGGGMEGLSIAEIGARSAAREGQIGRILAC